MASAAVVLNEVLQASPEKDNFMRLSRLLNSGGSKIVSGFFDSKVPDLAIKLSDPLVLNVLQRLKKKKVINDSEWNKLFPPSGNVDSKSFDLSLSIKLLRQKEIYNGLGNPMNGWNNLPSQADTSIEADIARMRWYRNTFAHADALEVSHADFENYYDDIKGALLRILASYSDSSSVTQCEKKIDEFRTAPLSTKDVEQVRESLGCSGNFRDKDHKLTCPPGLDSEWYFGKPKLFCSRYQSGKLTKELETILITHELRQLAKNDVVKLDVFVSEDEYKRAQEQLEAKEGEELLEEFETKIRIEQKTSKLEIFDGDIVEDGENRVQAHLAVITSKDQVEEVLAELKKKDPDVAEATHNIWAYRIFDDKRNAYDENCDDDGDDTSGAKLLRFLQRTRATDVMVVVSCWYETTAEELGEVRFKCIQKSVLDLFLTHRIVRIPSWKIKKFYEEIKYKPFEKEQEAPKFEILHGETIEDRKSTFQAHLADITSREQVDQVLNELKKDRKIAKAKYNMWACRIYDEKKKSYIEEGNDDGENLGGERLLHLLQRSDAKNVVIIVTRWHGGIHLGNDRFKHINKCASDLLQQRKIAETSTSTASPDPKASTGKGKKSRK
ncbi:uncharacterized protein LOC116292303 [Actinia tenebrosa]|uniref:Uncharacterized protein LOC116292303 n=1 Tax=Actinia tenebrosa TaxID=6105 RepID=A0A6P8HRW6_ACTTE|nr:uncharacterized protein LOC116292303 [Actinia tenebrosa]